MHLIFNFGDFMRNQLRSKELIFARCCCTSLDCKVSGGTRPDRAKLSLDRLCRQSSAALRVSRLVLASVAISVATRTFQCAGAPRSEFCALDSWLRRRSHCDVAGSNHDRDLGATATRGVIELDSPSAMGCRDRHVSFDGLRLLVVALGDAHGAVVLAIP